MNTLFTSVTITPLTVLALLKIFGGAVVCAIIIALTYLLTHRKIGFRPSVLMTLILLVPISTIIMLVVGNNMARALSIGGGIALIRYRVTLDDPRDLTYIFMVLSIGIACGNGQIALALAATVFVCLIAILLSCIKFTSVTASSMRLKITIPENLDYYGIFDDILKKYCRGFELESIKTIDYGTLLELRYIVNIKKPQTQKEFIDEIRCRNGNLSVSLTHKNFE